MQLPRARFVRKRHGGCTSLPTLPLDFASVNSLQVHRFHLLNHTWPQPRTPHFACCFCTQLQAELFVLYESQERRCEALNVARWEEQTGMSMFQYRQRASNCSCSNWQTYEHPFEDDHAKGLIPARHNKDV